MIRFIKVTQHAVKHTSLIALSALILILSTWCPVKAQEATHLQITQLHLFIAIDGDVINITQHYILGNFGSDPVQTTPAGAFSFTLPASAYNVQPIGMENSALLIEGTSVAETRLIPIGEKALEGRFSYSIPLSDNPEISFPVPLPVGSAVLILMGTGWELSGNALIPFGTMPVGGENAQAYMVDPLESGDVLRFMISASTAPPSIEPESTTSPVSEGLVIGSSLLIIVVAFILLIWRNQRMPSNVPSQIREDVLKLAALNRALSEGVIDETRFEREREALIEAIHRKLDH